jgi:hypothetical protein
MLRFALVLSILGISALGACSSSGGGGPLADTQGGGDSVVTPDTAADGVAGDAAADGDGGPVTPACVADSDCAEPGATCTCRGVCVVLTTKACQTTQNCGGTQWCNPCTRHCEPTLGLCEPCESVTVCDPGTGCVTATDGPCAEQGVCSAYASGGSFCGRGCISAAGCPVGYNCIAVAGSSERQCVPKSGSCEDLGVCKNDGECPDGEKCEQGACAPGCVDDDECPTDGGGVKLICTKARCVPPCASNAECTLPAECDTASGRCKVPGACEDSAECAPESYCDKVTGDCIPGCLEDVHCQTAAKICKNKKCVAKGCEHNYQCGFNKVCDKGPGECVESTRADCSTCDAMSQSPQCGGEPALCVTFQDEEMNPLGDFCLLTCENDEIDKCPQGYQCEHIQSDDGSIDNFYCTRQCPDNPLGAAAP